MSRIPFLRGHIKAGRLYLLKALRCKCGRVAFGNPGEREYVCAECRKP